MDGGTTEEEGRKSGRGPLFSFTQTEQGLCPPFIPTTDVLACMAFVVSFPLSAARTKAPPHLCLSLAAAAVIPRKRKCPVTLWYVCPLEEKRETAFFCFSSEKSLLLSIWATVDQGETSPFFP